MRSAKAPCAGFSRGWKRRFSCIISVDSVTLFSYFFRAMKEIIITTQAELDALPNAFEVETKIVITGNLTRVAKTPKKLWIIVSGSARIDCVSGSARIGDVSGSARIDCVSGSARIGDVSGSARIDCVSGSARIGDVRGSARIDYVRGSARIDYVRGSAVITIYGDNVFAAMC